MSFWRVTNLMRDTAMFMGLTAATFSNVTLAADKLNILISIPYLWILFWSSIIATWIFGTFTITGAYMLITRQDPESQLREKCCQKECLESFDYS